MANPNITTAQKIEAEIEELRKLLLANTAQQTRIEARLTAVEELVTELKTPEPPHTGVTVKVMCSEVGGSYNPTTTAVLKHYAETWCRENGQESWVNPDVKKQFRFYPVAAARYAVDRVRQELGLRPNNGNGSSHSPF